MVEESTDKELTAQENKKNMKEAEKKTTEGETEDKKVEMKPATKTEKLRPTNCIVCNKAFKYKRWYYRNGKYFCTKRCWKKFAQENKEKKKEAKSQMV